MWKRSQHLTTALDLLTTLPDTRERAQQELTLHVTLGVPLQATRGFSSPEVKATYTRARELCQQVGETRQLFPVLIGLRTFHQVRGEFLTARELGEQLLGLAQREQDPALLLEAYWALGTTLFHLGEFGAAQAHLEQSLTLYDAQRHHSHVFLYSMEPGVFSLSLQPWSCGIWAIRTRRYRRARQRVPWPKSCLIPSAWPPPGFLLPCLTSSAGKDP